MIQETITPNQTLAPSNDSSKSCIQPNQLPGVYDKDGRSSRAAFEKTVFWGDDPNILIQSTDLFPTSSMSFNGQINALTRCLILITLFLSLALQTVRFLFVGGLCLFMIWVFVLTRNIKREGFVNHPYDVVLSDLSGDLVDGSDDFLAFQEPKSHNPFSNVLLTDYVDNPQRKAAPPMDEAKTAEQVLKKAKQMVQRAHPNFPDLGERLFSNLGDQYQFEQSMQPFYSFSSTTIPNDQKGFADFCYGDMISCKEGNLFACARNLPRYGEGS